ncbi:MAG: 3-phosphoshikimate 1-carboxyvinyltransferase [Candidatus Eremiobacteraeota bacterium]|nr:3-phosphoshikimate 1-carboxyvinyltransferase [Candidatus Eremiobacteraeota bacterium]MBC5804229.1 3-phosphoshikimate 1-carboxyvinyltransferase [Candidatus Eremiobacteraeota bacterium]MBC5820502.1 3-phosphoshikimate 1-carboxyvinyltransferase [Candidatus Eremiobacteraeota bacterium]
MDGAVAERVTFERGALRGDVRVVGDKSISHRALMLAAATPGRSVLHGLNRGDDVLATRDAIVALGAHVDDHDAAVVVEGGSLASPAQTLDARNSGTTARLLMGLCAGRGLSARFDGDASLRRRPMERIARPLRALGAEVRTHAGRLPAHVRGIAAPPAGDYALEIASAQVKSAILFANLDAGAAVRIAGDSFTRDHTERLLRRFGRSVHFDGRTIELEPGRLVATQLRIPTDLSGAAFFLAGAALVPDSDLRLRDVGINPTRTGVIDALRAMGAHIEIEHERDLDGEPIADLRVCYRPLHATTLAGELIVRAIDEIAILAVVAAHARGVTHIRDAGDLRGKESDRLTAIAQTLRACGVRVDEFPDGLDIEGGRARVPRGTLRTYDDHRIAMAIAALAAPTGPHAVDDAGCIAVSFPGFVPLWRGAQTS